MENVTRIGVSLEPELLEKFDKLIEGKGYTTRSEAIRDLIREELVKDIVKDDDAKIFGTITLIYEHHKGSVKEQLMDIQHAHHTSISSSIHVHLNLEQCLEVLIVSGTVRDVKHLSDEIGSVRGVTHMEPVMISGSLEGHSHHQHEQGQHTH